MSNPSNGTVAYNATNQTVQFTPTTGYTGPAGFTYTLTDGRGGNASANVSLTVSPPSTTASLFSASSTPGTVTRNDPGAVELGVKFQASGGGTITGLRFYKGPQNTGTHVGDLWSATGTLLASATFTGETASGWQQVNLATPVTITAGTTYVAAYHTNTGFYSVDTNYFSSPLTNGPLTAPSSSSSGGNGVYAYAGTDSFPRNTFNASNYWVDVVFNPNTANHVPVANNDGGFVATENTPLSIPASALLANDADPDGDALSITGVSNPNNGTVAYNATNQTVQFTPTTGYTGPAGFTYTLTDGRGGNASANVSLTVSPTGTTASLFSASSTPGTVTRNDPSAVELGVKFQASGGGTITGLRFYKGPQNTGTHVGDLWSATGTLLASATFTGETASGWQQVNFWPPRSPSPRGRPMSPPTTPTPASTRWTPTTSAAL